MADQKRSFPYQSVVPEIEFKKRAVSIHPGVEALQAKVYDEPDLGDTLTISSTDFSAWTDPQLRAFLEQRGEEHNDCDSRAQLLLRAAECELSTGPAQKPTSVPQDGEENDPLDAFMAELHEEANKQEQQQDSQSKFKKAELNEEEDNVADFLEARERNGTTGGVFVAEGYNSDDEVYATEKAMRQGEEEEAEASGRQQIGNLPAVDHDSIDYEPFAKDFYTAAPKIAAMTPAEGPEASTTMQVNTMRRQMGIRVSGFDAPGPVEVFEQCGLGPATLGVIKRAGYQKPTGIQAQALPAALSGRDVLGIAKTGSGKTAAFVLPMVVHIQDQAELEKGEGPIGVIVAPTRELAEQIHKEARKFAKPFGMRIAAGIGGLSKFEQFKHLKAGSDAAVCTPGRLIDLVKMKACTLRRTTYIVFDEADRMFDMGFEPQVRSIIGQIRPDRQTMLFSATMPTKVERLVRDALTSPVRVTVGEVGAANEDIRQAVEVMDEKEKMGWLLARLPEMVDSGEVLVFANKIARVEEVLERLKAAGHRAVGIHGDMDQHTRAKSLAAFGGGAQHVLVATDVAARGLDIKSIKSVVNLDAAADIDTHVHRVGRTGRAGDTDGVAFTLLTPHQARFAGLLVNSLVAANQEISPALQALALKDPRFRKGHTRNKAGGRFSASGAKRRKSDNREENMGHHGFEILGCVQQQVGGAGIGFGEARDDPMAELYGSRAGFTKGEDLSTTTPAEQPQNQQPPAQPRPLTTPVTSSRLQDQTPPPPVVGGGAPPPALVGGPPPAAGGVFGGQGIKGIMQNRFMSQFVTSGSQGGEVNEKPTIIAPKKSVQPPTQTPSFLAKKLGQSSASAQAQQAIAAAKAVAARLAGGLAVPSDGGTRGPPPPVASAARGGGHGGANRPQLPAGFGSSASAYPDLSRDRSDRSDRPQRVPEPALGSSAGSYPEISRDHDRSRTSSFSGGAAHPPLPDHGNPTAQTTNPTYPSAYTAATPPPNPYAAQYAVQPPMPQPYQQPPPAQGPTFGQQQFQPPPQPHVQPPQPQPTLSHPPGSLQASIAAAQAIAARLTAQAAAAGGGGGSVPSGPRLGGVGVRPSVDDSVQASIEAAKAVAARFSTRDGGGQSALGSQAPNSGGQWAWGKGS